MRAHLDSMDDEPQIDPTMQFYVFMLVFWPAALVFGLIDFVLIPDYDLRLLTLGLGLLCGWIGVSIYKSKERQRQRGEIS